jgi:hypothetical protein
MSGTMRRKVGIRTLPEPALPMPQDEEAEDTPAVQRARRTKTMTLPSYTEVNSDGSDGSDLVDSDSDPEMERASDYSDANDSDSDMETASDDSDLESDSDEPSVAEEPIDEAEVTPTDSLPNDTTAVVKSSRRSVRTAVIPAIAALPKPARQTKKKSSTPPVRDAPARYHVWSPEEEAALNSAVKKCGTKWVAVAALMPGRTNEQCRKRWIAAPTREKAKTSKPIAWENKTPRNDWNPKEDALLKSAVKKCGAKWVEVAKLLPGRTNEQCRKRWYGYIGMDSSAKSRGLWTAAEDARLTAAVKEHGDKEWSVIAPLVRGRNNEQCRRRWLDVVDLNTKRVTGPWSATEDANLTAVVKTHGDTDWKKVAALVPGRSYLQCRQRWIRYLTRTDLTMGQFTAEEDVKLTAAVLKHGIKNWTAVAEMVPHRTFQQCRNRWVRALGLKDRTKGKWTAAEDAKLTAAVKKYGGGDDDDDNDDKWFAVAKHVPGRTYLQCRQRWGRSWGPRDRTTGKKTLKAKAKNKAGYTAEGKRVL